MKQGATIVTLMTRILKKKNKFKRSITPITLILKEMTNYKKMPQTLWHEDMWLGSFRSVVRLLINKQQDMTRRFLSRSGKQEMSEHTRTKA
jgi:predicted patatin/cPLA2 family phospholipase